MPVHRHPVTTTNKHSSLLNVPVDQELIQRLQSSFTTVRESGLQLGELFYSKLFEAAPNLRQLFTNDPHTQSKKLLMALDVIVCNLEKPEETSAYISALGKRHVGYGAKPEHYDLVINLLIESMREVLGANAEPQTLDEWRTALRLVSNQMIAASVDPSEKTTE